MVTKLSECAQFLRNFVLGSIACWPHEQKEMGPPDLISFAETPTQLIFSDSFDTKAQNKLIFHTNYKLGSLPFLDPQNG